MESIDTSSHTFYGMGSGRKRPIGDKDDVVLRCLILGNSLVSAQTQHVAPMGGHVSPSKWLP